MDLHPILNNFLETWVYPTGFSGPGYEFRMRQTERCIPVWNGAVRKAAGEAQQDCKSKDREYLRRGATAGYAGEGPQMSIKQMSTQILSVTIDDQERYIDLQRMRARQIWDEMKHGQLHADVLIRGGWVEKEEDLMDSVHANSLGILSYFGMTAMFPHIHPLARAAQHYFFETLACMQIEVRITYMNDPLDLHDNLSQHAEEIMHFMEGKYQMDAYALAPEDQKPIEEAFDFLLQPWGPTLDDVLKLKDEEAA